MMEESLEAERRRLRWQCRRGMKEIDLLLLRYLDGAYLSAGDAERAAFVRLLQVEDDQLWRWLLGREVAQEAALAGLIGRIRERV